MHTKEGREEMNDTKQLNLLFLAKSSGTVLNKEPGNLHYVCT